MPKGAKMRKKPRPENKGSAGGGVTTFSSFSLQRTTLGTGLARTGTNTGYTKRKEFYKQTPSHDTGQRKESFPAGTRPRGEPCYGPTQDQTLSKSH